MAKKNKPKVDEDEMSEEEIFRQRKDEWKLKQLKEKLDKKMVEERFKKKKNKMKLINEKNKLIKEEQDQKKQEEIERKTSDLKSKIVADLFSNNPRSIKTERVNYRNKIIEQNIVVIKIIKYVEFLINIDTSYSHTYRNTIANTVKGFIKNIKDTLNSDKSEEIFNELCTLHEYIYFNPPKNLNQKTKYIDSVGRILLLNRNNSDLLNVISDELKKIYDVVRS